MEARLPNLRPQLDLWHRNKSVSGFKFWFRVMVDPTHKTRQSQIVNFKNYLEKYYFFANDSKHRHIIYSWKSFFTTSMNSRSLPQNETLFDSDPLAKFVAFAWKSVLTIQALSSWMEEPYWRGNCAEHDGTKDCHKK